MKGFMKKALSLVMMLAMVATILVVPNVDAEAAVTEREIYLILSAPTSSDIVLDMYQWKGANDARNLESDAEKDAALTSSWGRDLYKFTKVDDTTYKIKVTGTVPDGGWNDMQFVFDNGSRGYKFKLNDDNAGARTFFNDNSKLYYSIDMKQTGWVDAPAPTAQDPNAATAQDIMDVISAIGTVELSKDCKGKIAAARAAYDTYTGNKADVTNYNVLTAAETEWDRLIAAGAGKVTLHVKCDSWTACNVYGWDLDNAPVLGTWPGTALAKSEKNTGWYNGTFEIKEAINIKFDEKSGGKESDNWEYFTAGEYWVTIAEDNSFKQVSKAPTGWVDENAKPIEPTTPDSTDKDNTTDKTETTTPSTTEKYQQKYKSAIVAGDFSKLKNCNISSAWDTQTTANNMQYLGNGVYKFVLTFDKTTEEVTVEYKVAFNNSWDVSIGAKSTNTNGTTENGANYKLTIPAGTSSVTIVASEKDTAVYDSITNAAKVAEYEVIANKGETTPFALYISLMVVGCGLVVVASKKRHAL